MSQTSTSLKARRRGRQEITPESDLNEKPPKLPRPTPTPTKKSRQKKAPPLPSTFNTLDESGSDSNKKKNPIKGAAMPKAIKRKMDDNILPRNTDIQRIPHYLSPPQTDTYYYDSSTDPQMKRPVGNFRRLWLHDWQRAELYGSQPVPFQLWTQPYFDPVLPAEPTQTTGDVLYPQHYNYISAYDHSLENGFRTLDCTIPSIPQPSSVASGSQNTQQPYGGSQQPLCTLSSQQRFHSQNWGGNGSGTELFDDENTYDRGTSGGFSGPRMDFQ